MLYDKRWDTEVKADPFSLESLIAWLETMPANAEYNWECLDGGCLIGLYGIAMGENWRKIHTHFWRRDELRVARTAPHTFGAALERARKVADAGC